MFVPLHTKSEHSAGYHHFWTNRFFAGLERRTNRLNDWNRFRLARTLKWLVFLVIAIALLGATQHESAVLGRYRIPQRARRAGGCRVIGSARAIRAGEFLRRRHDELPERATTAPTRWVSLKEV